jgi:hypothetical protein
MHPRHALLLAAILVFPFVAGADVVTRERAPAPADLPPADPAVIAPSLAGVLSYADPLDAAFMSAPAAATSARAEPPTADAPRQPRAQRPSHSGAAMPGAAVAALAAAVIAAVFWFARRR